MLSAASEAANEQGAIYTTPAEITAKYMWTPPIPNASQLVHQLAAADVYLEEDAIDFFMRLCGGHRSIFMRAMEWVQWMQRENKTRWDVGKVHAEVRKSWASSNWTTDDNSSLLGVLASVRAVRVNGVYKDANKIPKEFVHILCEGPRNGLAPSVRRDLTIHGFLLPSPKAHSTEEFQPYDWHTVDAKYRVSNHIMGLYYRQVLEKQRQLTVDVDKHPTSCADLLLRAVPFLSFAQVVALPGSMEGEVVSPLSAEGLPKEPRYTSAMVQVLKEQGFQAEAMDDEHRGKVDLQVDVNGKIFAVEALMAPRSAKSYFEHRDRFDNASRPFYSRANYKCLVIIGAQKNVENMKKRMRELRGGIEVVWLAPKPCTYKLSSLCQARRCCFGLLHPMRSSCKEFHHPQETAIFWGKPCSEVEVHRARLVCFDEDKPTSIPIFLNCLFAQFVGVLLESPLQPRSFKRFKTQEVF